MTAQCLIVVDEQQRTESCEITVCANVNEYSADWQLENGGTVSERIDKDSKVIKLDGQGGISLPYTILKDNLTCYAIHDASRVYCAKDLSL
ncbi:hypothetical protein [uncultured Shewanella sp.]|uniref:hypothetical protein n=1 Tax=uncultured Shewanella sp. TaxID=173975 RepID=UPI002623423F|nr:hypothetical protein [uncultured Shewanella sp.]